MKRLTVIVCNGAGEWPQKTISSINKEKRNDCEIVICTNKRYPKKRGVEQIVISTSVANTLRNRGAVFSKSEYLLFVDDDVELGEGWKRDIFSCIQKKVDVGTGKLVCGGEKQESDLNENGLLIKRSIFNEFKFDETIGPGTIFASSEAYDLKLRLSEGGFKIDKCDYVVRHPKLCTNCKKVLSYSLGNGYIYARYKQRHLFLVALVKTGLRLVIGSRKFTRRELLIRMLSLPAGYFSHEE